MISGRMEKFLWIHFMVEDSVILRIYLLGWSIQVVIHIEGLVMFA